MSNYNNLKTTIDANIKQNGNQEITGPILNSVLNQMVNILGTGYQFAGIATLDPATDPGTPDAKVFYIANGKGTYTNFGGLEVTEDEVVVLYWDSAWHKVATGIASQAKLSELEKFVGDYTPVSKTLMTTTEIIENWALLSNGNSVEDSNSKLVKYPVTAGDFIELNLTKDNEAVYQFQSVKGVPSVGINSNIIGNVCVNASNGVVKVPAGATWLIVSQLKTNATNSVHKCHNTIDNTPTTGSNNLVKSGGVKNELDQLQARIQEIKGYEWNNWEWNDGSYISDTGVVTQANNTRYSRPVQVNKGDIIHVTGAGTRIAAISKTDALASSYVCKVTMNNNTSTEYSWTADEDCYIAISGRGGTASGIITGYITILSEFATREELTSLEVNIEGIQEDCETLKQAQTIYGDYADVVDAVFTLVGGYYIKSTANNTAKAQALGSASNCGYTTPIQLRKKEKISFYTQGSSIGNICLTDANGDYYTMVVSVNKSSDYAYVEYIAEEDCYVALSSRLVGFEYATPKISQPVSINVAKAVEDMYFDILDCNIKEYIKEDFESGYYNLAQDSYIPNKASNSDYKCIIKPVVAGQLVKVTTIGLGVAIPMAVCDSSQKIIKRYTGETIAEYIVAIQVNGYVAVNCYKTGFDDLKLSIYDSNVQRNTERIKNLEETHTPIIVYNQIKTNKSKDSTKYIIEDGYTIQNCVIKRTLPTRSFITRFAVFGDMHIGWNMPDYLDTWHKPLTSPTWEDKVGMAFKNACKHSVDFGLGVGDQIQNAWTMIQESIEERDEYYRQLKNFDVPLFSIDGNHDTACPDWIKNAIIEFGNVRIICFFAQQYVDTTTYVNTKCGGDVSDADYNWLRDALIDSHDKGYITMLACHYPLANTPKWDNPDYSQAPLPTGYTEFEENIRNHRNDIVNLCEQYGAVLMLNGHLHWNAYMLVNKDNDESIDMLDVEFGNTSNGYHIVTVYDDRIEIKGYNPVTDEELRSLTFPLTNIAGNIVTTGTWSCR